MVHRLCLRLIIYDFSHKFTRTLVKLREIRHFEFCESVTPTSTSTSAPTSAPTSVVLPGHGWWEEGRERSIANTP